MENITFELNIRLGNERIPQSRFTKFLGLWIDEKLNWQEHTTRLLIKLKSNVNLLKTGRNFLSQHALRVVYFAQIHSNLSYGIGIWGSLMPKQMLTKLQSIQNICLEIIDRGRSSSKETSGILTVANLVDLELCKLWHKNSLGLLPKNLSSNMNTDHHDKALGKRHRYNTRHKNLQNRPKSTIHQYHDSFLVKGNRLYSQLEKELHCIKSIQHFNTVLKKKLLSN